MGLSLIYYVVPSIVVLILIRKYREKQWGYCKNKVKLNNKIAIITGANSGLGFEIARELALRGAHVVLACRNPTLAEAAMLKIKQEYPSAQLTFVELDLASLKSIKKCAEEIKESFDGIDILVNNAGVALPKNRYQQTQDGIELHFGVNHLGHFYLTISLLDSMNINSRIIVITSKLHEKGNIDFDLIRKPSKTNAINLYANSKLANVYFCRELARRVKSKSIRVYGVCPGWVYTSLFRYSVKWYHYILVAPIAFLFMRSAKQGAQTAIYCATEPRLNDETGLLYRDCQIYTSKLLFKDELGIKLWAESEKIRYSVMH